MGVELEMGDGDPLVMLGLGLDMYDFREHESVRILGIG